MKSYIGDNKIIQAESEVVNEQEGYTIIGEGNVENQWLPKEEFELIYREVTEGEEYAVIDAVVGEDDEDPLVDVLMDSKIVDESEGELPAAPAQEVEA